MSRVPQAVLSPDAPPGGSPFQMPPRRRRIALTEAAREATAQTEQALAVLVILAGLVATLGALFLAH